MLTREPKQQKTSQPHLLLSGEHSHANRSRSPTLDWQFSPENETWETLVTQKGSVAPGQHADIRRVCSRVVASGLVILVLISVSLYLWSAAEGGAQMLEAGLRSLIAIDRQHDHSTTFPDTSNVPVSANTVEMHSITYNGNVVNAEIHSTFSESDGYSYTIRQRRFYRSTESGWIAVPPSSEFLGPIQSYETEFFSISYYKLDATSVESVAAEIDTIYAQLRQDYALPPAAERMTVALLIDPPKVEYGCYEPNHLCLASPTLAVLPIDLLESDALRLWLLNALANQVARIAFETNAIRYEWHDAETLLPYLQIRRHSNLVSAWHTDVVQWLYGIQERTPKPDATTLAQELGQLCALHQIRIRHNFFIGAIPFDPCVEPTGFDLWRLTNYKAPAYLSQLSMPDSDLRASALFWSDILEVEVLLDYVVATYGQDILPALLEAFRHHSSWHTLIPTVFEVSVEEFEVGWQKYLQTYH